MYINNKISFMRILSLPEFYVFFLLTMNKYKLSSSVNKGEGGSFKVWAVQIIRLLNACQSMFQTCKKCQK